MVFHDVVRVQESYVVTESVTTNRESVLRLIQQIRAMKGVAPVHHRHTLSIALWKWTEAGGVPPHPKYNIRYVSHGVVAASEPTAINHEHVHTRKSMVDELLAPGLTEDEALDYLQARGEACVVTVEEHAQLGASAKSGWARYVDAGIGVFDRQQQQYVDPMSIMGVSEPPRHEPNAPRGDGQCSIQREVEEDIRKCAPLAVQPLLLQLVQNVQLASAVPALQNTKHKPSYFRIHDTVLEEPTRAAAYANFNGNLDLALDPHDVPRAWAAGMQVRAQDRKPYLVRWRIHDDESLRVATQLLVVALEKVRGEAAV